MAHKITLLELSDLEAFVSHNERLFKESGVDGTPFFHCWMPAPDRLDDKWKNGRRELWEKPLTESGWGRAWGLWSGDKIVGTIELKTEGLETLAHRVKMGMGIERAFCGKGAGTKLLETAIVWSYENGFTWMDLSVFETNEPAIALYEKMGFFETGHIDDFVRINGQSIADVQMTLKLR